MSDRKCLELMLSHSNCIIDCFLSGEEALAKCVEANNNNNYYDIIIVSDNLPTMVLCVIIIVIIIL
jgi:hypothetical protein